MFWKRRNRNADLDRELRSHLDLEAEEQRDRGLSPEEAGYAARRALGNATQIKESVYAVWHWAFLDQLLQDLRYATRTLRRAPGFAAIALLSLALGIGANTAIFSLLDAVILKSLPVSRPEQLRILMWSGDGQKLGMQSHSGYNLNGFDGSFSYPAYKTLRNSLPQFSALVAFATNQFTVSAHGTSDLVFGDYVSGNYFTGLGAQPFLGRPILPTDHAVAVLTYKYWSRRFGADPNIVGRVIAINRVPVTVIGVMPPAFGGLMPGRTIDVFLPLSMVPETAASYYSLTKPDFWWVQIFGRLKPGVSSEAAATAVQAAFVHEIESYTGKTLPAASQPKIALPPGGRGVGLLRDRIGNEIYILAVVSAIVLLIACANLAACCLRDIRLAPKKSPFAFPSAPAAFD